jgi:hypothetical protein
MAMATSSAITVSKMPMKKIGLNKYSFKRKISFKTSSASMKMILEKAEYKKKAKVKGRRKGAKQRQ